MITDCQINIQFTASKSHKSCPITLISANNLENLSLSLETITWMKSNDFHGKTGQILFVPNSAGQVQNILLGIGEGEDRFITGKVAKILPAGHWHFEGDVRNQMDAALGLAMGAYDFSPYKKTLPSKEVCVFTNVDLAELKRLYQSVALVRNLINTPTNDMGPDAIELAMRKLGAAYGADVQSICGDDLLKHNFPMIHAVGRASNIAPRIIDLRWGQPQNPLITLVGKGVAFDTGGLDIKPSSGMLLMKKDMGGAANVLGLAQLIMDAKLPLRLRVLIPAVENSISSNAFRPSDILKSRKGLTVEVGNTDAEGRLILADALAYGDEESPTIMLDMATLTGAARVALGPDLPPFYCDDKILADKIYQSSIAVADPLWQMPLWSPYAHKLSSRVADLNNVTSDSFAGSITAALFLKNFVEKAKTWAHFDIYGWTPVEKPAFPVGGEAQGIRALYHMLKGL